MAKRGRPNKQNTISLKKVEELASYGLIEDQIASLLDISKATLSNYKDPNHASYFPKFLEVLNKGKAVADSRVTKSLYERALGYEHEEDKLFCHEGAIISAKVIKHYPPDSTAMIYWTKNRRRDLWRDKVEVDHGLQDSLLEQFKEWTPDEIRAEQAKVAGAILETERTGKTQKEAKSD